MFPLSITSHLDFQSKQACPDLPPPITLVFQPSHSTESPFFEPLSLLHFSLYLGGYLIKCLPSLHVVRGHVYLGSHSILKESSLSSVSPKPPTEDLNQQIQSTLPTNLYPESLCYTILLLSSVANPSSRLIWVIATAPCCYFCKAKCLSAQQQLIAITIKPRPFNLFPKCCKT